jgi:hypothetical protein
MKFLPISTVYDSCVLGARTHNGLYSRFCHFCHFPGALFRDLVFMRSLFGSRRSVREIHTPPAPMSDR